MRHWLVPTDIFKTQALAIPFQKRSIINNRLTTAPELANKTNLFKVCYFAPLVIVAKLVTMITEEHDDSVVVQPVPFCSLEDNAHVRVGVGQGPPICLPGPPCPSVSVFVCA